MKKIIIDGVEQDIDFTKLDIKNKKYDGKNESYKIKFSCEKCGSARVYTLKYFSEYFCASCKSKKLN